MLPSNTSRPCTVALTPRPGKASKSEGSDRLTFIFWAALTTAWARGCSLPFSTDPAKPSICASEIFPINNIRYGGLTLRQRSRLVEDDRVCFVSLFQLVTSL